MADVSVVIPTRDRSQMLELALRTALYQRDVDLEVIVVDDGSTDDTAATVAGLSDPRVRLLRNRASEGVSAARNRGIEQAAGRWIAFLDDDDLWAPDKLARQLESARSSGRGWVYAGNVGVDSQLQILGGAPPPSPDEVVASLGHHNAVPAGASNVVVDARVLAAAGAFFDPFLTVHEDWDLWIRLARSGPPAWVRGPLVALRQHPGNASRNMVKMLEEMDTIGVRYDLPVDRARHYRWAAWSSLSEARRRPALRYYAGAVALGDVKSLARALLVLVSPSAAMRVRGSDAHRSSNSWGAEAQTWLDALLGT